MSWQRDVVAKLIEFEGSVPHMYLDSVGLVTVGVGSLLRTPEQAEALPFVSRETGERVAAEHIRAEWEKLSRMEQNNYAAGYYRKHTNLELPDEAIEHQVIHHMEDFIDGLRRSFPDFDSYPEQARKAILDMTFNLGLNGVLTKFPSFVAAFRAQDWDRCRAECNRRGIAEARNTYVKDLFQQLTT